MGCGGSKQPGDDNRPAIPLEPQPHPGPQAPSRRGPQTARAPGGSKAPSRRGSRAPSPRASGGRRSTAPSRRASRASSPTKAASHRASRTSSPTGSKDPSRKGSRPPSQRGSRQPSRQGSPGPSAPRTRHRSDRPRASVPLSILEELPAEDGTIRNEIGVLDSYIEQHVVKFYRSESDRRGISLRRRIADT